MALLGLLVYVFVRSFYPARIAGPRREPAVHAARGVQRGVRSFALLLFGSNVTAHDAVVRVPGLAADERRRCSRALTDAERARHVLHRWVAVVVGRHRVGDGARRVAHAALAPVVVRLAVAAAVLFPIQALVGGLQVLTGLADWTQTLHLALGAIIWALAAALAVAATTRRATAVAGRDSRRSRRGRPAPDRRRRGAPPPAGAHAGATPSAPTSR